MPCTCCMGARGGHLPSDRTLGFGSDSEGKFPMRIIKRWSEESTTVGGVDFTSTVRLDGTVEPEGESYASPAGWFVVAAAVGLLAVGAVLAVLLVRWKVLTAGQSGALQLDRQAPAQAGRQTSLMASPLGESGPRRAEIGQDEVGDLTVPQAPSEASSLLTRSPGIMADSGNTEADTGPGATAQRISSTHMTARRSHPSVLYHPPPPSSPPPPTLGCPKREGQATGRVCDGPHLHYAELELVGGARRVSAQPLIAEKTDYAIILGELKTLVSTPLSPHPN